MNLIILIVYFLICLACYLIFRLLYKNRYLPYYKIDNVIDTDEESFIKYETEKEYQNYISSYSVYSNGDARFVIVDLNEKVEYISYEIVCYKNKKVISILNLLKDEPFNPIKNDKFTIKLPDNADEIKLRINEVNGIVFNNEPILNTKKLIIKSVISSVILSISASLIIFVFELLTLPSRNEYFSWSWLFANIYPSLQIFGYTLIFVLVFMVLFFLVSFVPNTIKYKNAKYNKIKKKKIGKLLKFKLIHKIVKNNNFYYAKIKRKRRPKFKSGVISVKIFFEDNTTDIKTITLTKKTKKILLSTNKIVTKIETNVITANYKKLYYAKNKFRRKVTKRGISGSVLHLKGIKATTYLFIVSILLSSGFMGYKFTEISSINGNLSKFTFVYNDESLKDSYKITNYSGNSKIVAIPNFFNSLPVTRIDDNAFNQNHSIRELYLGDNIREIGQLAFSNCVNLRKANLDRLTLIEAGAFFNANLDSINLCQNVTVSINAFSHNTEINRIFINGDSSVTLSDNCFKNSHTKLFEFYPDGNTFSISTFEGLDADKGFVYKNSTIGSINLRDYFSDEDILVENDCVHDQNSFMYLDGKLIDKRSYTSVAILTPATCSSYGVEEVRCEYCGARYTIDIPNDPNVHTYSEEDGKCIYCGKLDPDFVPKEEEEEE